MIPEQMRIAQEAGSRVNDLDLGTMAILGGVIAVAVLIVVLVILRWRPDFLRVDIGSQALRSREMSAEIATMRGQVEAQKEKIDGQAGQIALLLDQLVSARAENQKGVEKQLEAQATIKSLERELSALRQQLEGKKLIEPMTLPKDIRVLGIWTEAPGLDPQANIEALARTGVKYVPLSGAEASMEAISYAVPSEDINTVEIGLLGNADGMKLADGIVTHEWWINLARRYPKLENFLLLADLSGTRADFSIAQAIFQVPTVKAVISVTGRVEDTVARKFARRFYVALSGGESLSSAFESAKLAVEAKYGRLFRLLEKSSGS